MAQQGKGGGEDGAETWLIIIIILLALLFFLVSHFFWVYTTAWKWVRVVEIGVLAYAVPDFIQAYMENSFNMGLHFLLSSNPKDITAEMVGVFDNMFVLYFNWLPAALIIWAGIKIMMKAEDVTTVYDMENILTKMVKAFPHNKRFIGIHPEESPIDFYPDDPTSYEFSMCMTERQFGACNPPLGLMKLAEKNPAFAKPIWDGAKGFDEFLARKSFESQMGPLYTGYNNLSDDERTLTDLFRNKILVKRIEVLPIMKDYTDQIYKDRISTGVRSEAGKKGTPSAVVKPTIKYLADYPSHKVLVEKLTGYVDSNLQKHGTAWKPKDVDLRNMVSHKDFKSVLRHCMCDERLSKHAYTYTGLMTLLEAAREGATLAPSTFRWLKGKNRTLWFALNCVGKKVAFTESSGTFAHWLLEKQAKLAIPHAEVTEAINALKTALGLNPDKDREAGHDDW
ncbi:IcmP (DotM) [Pseudomonas putida]|uniref:IcmP (DotM) n=1 Tax=Pseudomonas putida TaxID=303 RepID=A0A8I1JIF0_PSEPU|nr:IcmP (DotM) [Pseudomonas putida]MBI6882908.1 IcmP (DotM) [Pseudomonas putida]